jgi:hypothetical protein
LERTVRRFLVAGCLAAVSCNLLPRATNTASPSSPSPVDTSAEEAAALQAQCEAALGEFVDALSELDSRLAVGMQFSEYIQAVGDVRVVYDRVVFSELDIECVTDVGVPAERALNLYVQASNLWNNCIGNFTCDFNQDLEPRLQDKWAAASAKVDEAQTGLVRLGE